MKHRWTALIAVLALCALVGREISGQRTATPPSGNQRIAGSLGQNFPNPFNPETTISFDLPEAGQVEMNLYDFNGRRVRQLLAAFMPAGRHRLLWNGQDDNGWPAHSGVYFLVLRARFGNSSKKVQAMRKIILMK